MLLFLLASFHRVIFLKYKCKLKCSRDSHLYLKSEPLSMAYTVLDDLPYPPQTYGIPLYLHHCAQEPGPSFSLNFTRLSPAFSPLHLLLSSSLECFWSFMSQFRSLRGDPINAYQPFLPSHHPPESLLSPIPLLSYCLLNKYHKKLPCLFIASLFTLCLSQLEYEIHGTRSSAFSFSIVANI